MTKWPTGDLPAAFGPTAIIRSEHWSFSELSTAFETSGHHLVWTALYKTKEWFLSLMCLQLILHFWQYTALPTLSTGDMVKTKKKKEKNITFLQGINFVMNKQSRFYFKLSCLTKQVVFMYNFRTASKHNASWSRKCKESVQSFTSNTVKNLKHKILLTFIQPFLGHCVTPYALGVTQLVSSLVF